MPILPAAVYKTRQAYALGDVVRVSSAPRLRQAARYEVVLQFILTVFGDTFLFGPASGEAREATTIKTLASCSP